MTKWIESKAFHNSSSALYAHARIWAIKSIGFRYMYSHLRLLTLVIMVSLSYASSSQDSSSTQYGSSDYILHVNANLVILSAIVVDHHNALVSGLDKDDFKVYENHILKPIKHFSHEDVPITVGLVIDNSGSMGPKRNDVIAAGLSFANSSNPQDQIFVVNFNEHVAYGLPADTPFTDRRDQLQRALSAINTIGETALYDAIATALDHLKQGRYDKKILIVISDGGDNASKHTLAQVIEMAKASDAIIYTIGIFDAQDGDQNPGVLKRFAKETGGEEFLPQSSKEIASICEEIARDIRNQYTLAYVPEISKLNSGYRTVEVKASSPRHGRLSVRTRTGYSVPSSLPLPALHTVGHDSPN
jgi:VWFA-related protein